MKKYVLNIDKLYSGRTANAIVLNQVNDSLPKLLPLAPSDDNVLSWRNNCKDTQPSFCLQEEHLFNTLVLRKEQLDSIDELNEPERYQQVKNNYDIELAAILSKVDDINEQVLDFNLQLQQNFTNKAKPKLYLMDDTRSLKVDTPSSSNRSLAYEKTYIHGLNGISESDMYSSQLNVLFPFEKLSSKSLYAFEFGAKSEEEKDTKLVNSKGVTLSGKVSYEDCLQGIANAGECLYTLTPCIDISNTISGASLQNNGLTVVNGQPYYFANTMTLFQPSQNQYKDAIEEFVDWYERHNHTTIVSQNEEYGDNVSTLICHGLGSYEINLATYAPTNLVMIENDGSWYKYPRLVDDVFRKIRTNNIDFDAYYQFGKYYIKTGDDRSTGFLFNLYDGFISDQERVLKLTIPSNKDSNKLYLRFKYSVVGEKNLPIDSQVIETKVYVDDEEYDNEKGYIRLSDTAIQSYTIKIRVWIHYDVDYRRRNSDQSYSSILQRAGVLIQDIWIDDGSNISENPKQLLTFGSYVNEQGISDEVHDERYEQFWVVSKYKKNIVYQQILESSLNNITSNGIEYKNNYATGDMFGDVFLTKSVLGNKYDMVVNKDDSGDWLLSEARKYIGIGNCSNQIYLVYNDANLKIKIDDDSNELNSMVESDKNDDIPKPRYQLIEVIKNINRFESSIKHKSNVFSVVVQNTNLTQSSKSVEDMSEEEKLYEQLKENMRDSIKQFVRDTCSEIVPVHTQLFDVQFT